MNTDLNITKVHCDGSEVLLHAPVADQFGLRNGDTFHGSITDLLLANFKHMREMCDDVTEERRAFAA